MKQFLALLAVGAAFALGAPAIAADKGGAGPNYNLNLPTPAPERKWTGMYFGGQVGSTLNTDLSLTENIPAAIGVGSALRSAYEVDGMVYGGHFGGAKQFGQIVFGFDVELNTGDLEGTTGNCLGIAALVGGGTSVNCTSQVNWMATGVMKAGVAAGIWQLYGQVGWTAASVDHNISAVIPPLGGLSLSNGKSEIMDGIAFGAGASVQLTQDWILTVDWKRHQLEGDGAGLALGGVVSSGQTELDVDVISARMSIKFR